MNTVAVKKELLTWALERSGVEPNRLVKRFPKWGEWERGVSFPTMNQLEALAKKLWVPIGYLFLPAPPEEKLPIPDFRTFQDEPVQQPSPDLLETVFTMQRRQEWFRNFLIDEGIEPLRFSGSFNLTHRPEAVAAAMRETLGITSGWARSFSTWEKTLDELGLKIEQAGITLVFNSVVGNNGHRKLDVDEFRGFVLSDPHAPLIFVNSADAKAAQMFTLAHELAHIWIGSAGVLNFRAMKPAENDTELFCNAVAAEFLIPKEELLVVWKTVKNNPARFSAIGRQFKVSPLVAARRVLDFGFITKEAFFHFYNSYILNAKAKKAEKKAAGESWGDFYANCDNRIGRSFAEAVMRATQEGKLLYSDAYRLTGLQGTTFDKYIKKISRETG